MFQKILYFCIFIAYARSSRDLPSYLLDLRCPRKDFEQCFVTNGNKAIPLVVNGDPDYNLPKMNPLEIPYFPLVTSPSLSMNVSNVKVFGLENLRIESSKFLIDQGINTVLLKGAKVTLDGEYVIDGKIMVLPIKGNGHFVIDLFNGSYKLTTSGNYIEKEGEQYYEPAESRLDYHFGKVEFKFDNLFEGNPKLADQMNKFLNDNWDLIIVDFGPGISKAIAEYISKIFKAFAAVVPMKKLFKD